MTPGYGTRLRVRDRGAVDRSIGRRVCGYGGVGTQVNRRFRAATISTAALQPFPLTSGDFPMTGCLYLSLTLKEILAMSDAEKIIQILRLQEAYQELDDRYDAIEG